MVPWVFEASSCWSFGKGARVSLSYRFSHAAGIRWHRDKAVKDQ